MAAANLVSSLACTASQLSQRCSWAVQILQINKAAAQGLSACALQGSRKASSGGPGSQNRKSAPGTPKAEGSAQGTPQQTPKRALPQRPPQLPAGRATRSILPSKRTLEASEDAEQQNDSPGVLACSLNPLNHLATLHPLVPVKEWPMYRIIQVTYNGPRLWDL